MKSLVFDTGPLITLTLNNLMWILEPLKKQFDGEFYISDEVEYELIKRPLEINRFKFEALHSQKYIRDGIIKKYPRKMYKKKAKDILDIANNMFYAQKKPIRIVHQGEIETIALADEIGAKAVVVDERTTIELIENPTKIRRRLQKKLHTKVTIDGNLNDLKAFTKGIRTIRSADLILMAYEMGLLDRYLPEGENKRRVLLDAVLWGLKLNGCTLANDEIKTLIKIEQHRK